MTFKADIFKIADEAAGSAAGWKFKAQRFQNGSLGHTVQEIDPGFTFQSGAEPSVSLQPCVGIRNKRIDALQRRLFGSSYWTSFIRFQHEVEAFRVTRRVYPSKFSIHGKPPDYWPEAWSTIDELPQMLRSILAHGLTMLNQHYDFTNERALLLNLPSIGAAGTAFDAGRISQCLGHIAEGDFDFVRHVDPNSFLPLFKERFALVLAALPGLEKEWHEKT